MSRRYASLYERLVANTIDPENDQACWTWRGHVDRSGYPRVNIRVPEVGHVKLAAHIVMQCIVFDEAQTPAEVLSFYRKRVASGLEHDHLCCNPSCVHPDHIERVTPKVNCRRREQRRAHARLA